MPLGITADQLRAIPDSDLIAAAECLNVPPELEPVLVASLEYGAIGRVVGTGREVAI